MDRIKLSIICSVAMIIMLIAFTIINLQTQEILKEVRVQLNDTDYNCCTIYRNPLMPDMCNGLRTGVMPFTIPSTSVPSFP